jgi:hypothetical protein
MNWKDKLKLRDDLQIKYKQIIYKEIQGIWISLPDHSENSIYLDGSLIIEDLRKLTEIFQQYLSELIIIEQIKVED